MPFRPGLDDDPHLDAVIAIWRDGSAEIDRRLAAVGSRMVAELANPSAPYVLGRLEAQQARLVELRDQAAFILDDALQQTGAWLESPRFAELYAAGARVTDAQFSFSAPHQDAVNVLARDTYSDVLAATAHVDEDAKAFVRRVGRSITTSSLTTGDPVSTSARALRRTLEREFRARGIGAITYRDGSRHSFGEYAEMLLRTKTGQMYNNGTLNAAAGAGIEIVEILDGALCGLTAHDDPELANGMIVTASFASGVPLAHPNCRRAFAPRPDLTRADLSLPGEGPSPRSVTTAPQRADQAAFEASLRDRRQNARGARGGPGGRRERRPRRDRGSTPARTRAETAAEGNARRRLQVERARLEAQARAGRAFRTERDNAVRGGRRPDPEVLRRWGVSDAQLRQGRILAQQIRSDVRAIAKREADELGGWIGESDLDVINRPDRLVQRTSVSGRTRYARTDSGYDFLETLDDATEARVRKRMVDDAAYAPDVMAERVRRVTGHNLTDDEAMEWLTDQWLREDALRSVASGRVPRYYSAEDLLPPDYALEGYRLDQLFGVDLDDAAGHVAQVQADAARQYAQRSLRPAKFGPDPWEMNVDDYVTELESLEDAFRAVDQDGVVPGPGFRQVRERLQELVPGEIDPTGALNPFELHERIRLTAQTAGFLDEFGAPIVAG